MQLYCCSIGRSNADNRLYHSHHGLVTDLLPTRIESWSSAWEYQPLHHPADEENKVLANKANQLLTCTMEIKQKVGNFLLSLVATRQVRLEAEENFLLSVYSRHATRKQRPSHLQWKLEVVFGTKVLKQVSFEIKILDLKIRGHI